MAALATNNLTVAGTKPTFVAAGASGDTARCGPGYFAIVKNAAGSTITLTLAVPGLGPNGVAVPDTAITVAATTGEAWVPLESYYADPTDGRVHMTYSSNTSVTAAIVKLP